MIQRIQSIFLLVSAAAALGLFGLPLAATEEPLTNSVLFADAQYGLQDHWSLMAAFGVAGLLLFGAIFVFRNRKLQMNLTLFGVLLTIIGAGVSAFFFGHGINYIFRFVKFPKNRTGGAGGIERCP